MASNNNRVAKLVGHLQNGGETAKQSIFTCETSGRQRGVFGQVGSKNDNDVVIVSALRTPICKARKGGFKETMPDDLLVAVFKGILNETKINPAEIQDVVIGNCQTPGAFNLPARTAALRAGIPETAGCMTLNRQCSSGSASIATIASSIATGMIDVGIAGGVEHMTSGGAPGDPSTMPPFNMSETFADPKSAACLTPMGMTSENVAAKFNISREKQDQMAVESHAKAAAAIKEGRFKAEIVPVTTIVEDDEGNEKEVVISQDEGVREGTTLESLAKLKPAFKKGGTTTAGNSSQVSDGAAACLLMTRAKAKQLGLPVKLVLRSNVVVGCDPSIMGIGPAVAIPPALEAAGVTVNDIDCFEVNEAFASQAIYSVEKLNIPRSKLNPKGGAIALGHPLSMTGSRMTATLAATLAETKGKLGVVSMCIGGGYGLATVFENEQL